MSDPYQRGTLYQQTYDTFIKAVKQRIPLLIADRVQELISASATMGVLEVSITTIKDWADEPILQCRWPILAGALAHWLRSEGFQVLFDPGHSLLISWDGLTRWND